MPTWSIIHSRHWKMQIPYLARHCRVLTFDGRGNGRSDRPSEPDAYRRGGVRRRRARGDGRNRDRARGRSCRCRGARNGRCCSRRNTRGASTGWCSSPRRSRCHRRPRACRRCASSTSRAMTTPTGGSGTVTTGSSTTRTSSSSSSRNASRSRTRPSSARTPSVGVWKPTPRRWSRLSWHRGSRTRRACARSSPGSTVRSS